MTYKVILQFKDRKSAEQYMHDISGEYKEPDGWVQIMLVSDGHEKQVKVNGDD